MTIKELLLRKSFILDKISIIDKYIKGLPDAVTSDKSKLYSLAINYKFELLHKLRSYELLLDTLNKDNTIELNGEVLTIYEALCVLKTLESKMSTLKDVMLNDTDKVLDTFNLLTKYEDIFEEIVIIKTAILSSDLKEIK